MDPLAWLIIFALTTVVAFIALRVTHSDLDRMGWR